MNVVIQGSPSFAYLDATLEPGESLVGESDAMATMAADLDLDAQFNGGFMAGLCKKFLGGESMFINTYSNNTDGPRRITLAQSTPGDMLCYDLGERGPICLQPGAFVASAGEVQMGVSWAGIKSLLAREGLFKLSVSGQGQLWFGAYGGIVERELDGEAIVDTSHLVAYDPELSLHLQLSNGIFGSLFSGEGLVTRLEGHGKYWLQTRSLSGLAGWLNPKL